MAFGKKKNFQSDDDLLDFGSDADGFGGSDDLFGSSEIGGDSFDFEESAQGKQKKKKNNGGGKGIGGIIGIAAMVIVAVLIVGMIFKTIGGPSKKECDEIVTTFEDGCREQNFMKLADVVNPKYRNGIKAILMVSTTLTDVENEQVMEMIDEATGGMLGNLSGSAGEGLSSVMKSMSIEPVKYGMPGKTRTVKCKVSVGIFEKYVNLTVKKANKQVYIAGAELADE